MNGRGHYNKMHILWLPFMTASSHKIPKNDWRWIRGGWRARWLGLVITDESLRTSVIWIYTVVWTYLRSRQHVGHALTGLGVRTLLWPARANPTWHVTMCSHVFCWRVILLTQVIFLLMWHATWNVTASFLAAYSHVFVGVSHIFCWGDMHIWRHIVIFFVTCIAQYDMMEWYFLRWRVTLYGSLCAVVTVLS